MAACSSCKRPIQNGTEDKKKAVTWKIKSTGQIVVSCAFEGIAEPPSGDRTIVGTRHYKCYKAEQKHMIRGGDSIRGRRMGNIPTAYEIAAMTANQDDLTLLGLSEEEARKHSTRQITEMVEHQREAMIARAASIERVSVEEMNVAVREAAEEIARERAALAAQNAVRDARENDPGYSEPSERKWPAAEPLELAVENVPQPIEPTAIGE